MDLASTSAPTARILSLPPELLNQLLFTLTSDPTNYHTFLSLRLTHPLFRSLITPTTLKSHHALLAAHYFQNEVRFIVSGTHKPVSTISDGWPCYICLYLQPRTNFAHSQTHASHSAAHAKARLRFCLACGVRKGIYVPGTVLRCFQGPDKVVCLECRRFGVSAKARGRAAVKAAPESNSTAREYFLEGSLADKPVLRNDVPKSTVNTNRDINGLCMDCAYCDRTQSSDHGAAPDETGNRGRMPGDYFVKRLLYYSDRDPWDFSHGTSQRKGRCQRCWAIDHTERAAHRRHGHQLLCQECWLRQWV